ncbi:tryptophan halogenase family protein [Moorena bouillonii]|uniref:Tryptophan halogenase n=1 Tax=Moorena bouillonii PNG TaxID=568701 RepID=A0A1U7N9N6_9CYAN|nr:tryptophan halogenase family protein [Moorena bouillonii]OLT62670.1 hypothetical protein BJP37_30220 [Moorena bouillonii PNG]
MNTVSNPNIIKTIIIVGGGTSGWLSAAYLSKFLQDSCQITLIESSDIGTVGVGEATLPTLQITFKLLGLSEFDWMTRCNASFKLGIKFVNWSGSSKPDIFWHPFGQLKSSPNLGIPISQYWLKNYLQGNTAAFDESCFEHINLCAAQKSPKSYDSPEYSGNIEYAYHLDAGKLATYLKERAKSAGVRHIVDNVLDVALDHRGFISHVITENHSNQTADFFIDCSGFRGLLINQALQEPFISYGDSLFCDRAIAISIPYEKGDRYNYNNGGINPYSTATALSSGWAWNVPLVERSGNGYVYSSSFMSQDDAETEFRKHLGDKANDQPAKYIKTRVGRTRNTWAKNCVSIGLSGGFIEPLESTGIYLVELGLEALIRHFPEKSFSPLLINNYNRFMREIYEEIRDFIVMHYCLTQREYTPFWRTNKYHNFIPDSLQEKLNLWKVMWPIYHGNIGHLFPDYSYVCILAGMGYFPVQSLPLLGYGEHSQEDKIILKTKSRSEQLRELLPDHHEYLQQMFLRNFKASWQSLLAHSSKPMPSSSLSTIVR